MCVPAGEKILEGRHVHRGFYDEQRHGPELIRGTSSGRKGGAETRRERQVRLQLTGLSVTGWI